MADLRSDDLTPLGLPPEPGWLLDVLQRLPAMVYIKDTRLCYTWVNTFFAARTGGIPRMEIVGKTGQDLYPEDYALKTEALERALLGGEAPFHQALESVPVEGGGTLRAVCLRLPLNQAGAITGVMGIMADIGEYAKDRALFMDLFENASILSITTDPQGIITRANRKARELAGSDDLIGRNFLEFALPEDHAQFITVWKKNLAGHEIQYEGPLLAKDGKVIPLLSSGRPLIEDGEVWALHYQGLDITENKLREQRLLHASGMETVAQVAGGIALEFNNLLSAINGYAEILLHSMDKTHPFYTKLEQIHTSGRKAFSLAEKVLDFSHKQKSQTRPLHIDSEVVNLEPILSRMVGEHIRLMVQLKAPAEQIVINPSRLAQVLINLVINAYDALPDGGEIHLSTETVTLGEGHPAFPGVPPGRYVRLCIKDTGTGMDAYVREHIFDQFFTTKAHGTGIGLWTVNTIVKESAGYILAESAPGQGTTFRILFPTIVQQDGSRSQEARQPSPDPCPPQRTILVVEDDDTVRDLITEILTLRGFQVLTACNGGDALQLARHHVGSIDLMLTDIIMRRIDGKRLSERIQALCPGIRVIYMSGYGDDVIHMHTASREDFLQKPFRSEALISKVEGVLSRP